MGFKMADYPDNPLWLYNLYKAIAYEEEGVCGLQSMFHMLTDKSAIGAHTDDSKALISSVIIPPEFRELVKAISAEWIAVRKVTNYGWPLTNRLGDDVVNFSPPPKFARTAEIDLTDRVSIALVNAIRNMGVLEHLRLEHEISPTDYDNAMKHVRRDMDIAGLNGVDRLLQSRPDIARRVAANRERIMAFPDKPAGHAQMPRGEFYKLITGQQNPDSEKTVHNEFVLEPLKSGTPEMQRSLDIIFGPEYKQAREAKENLFRKVMSKTYYALGGNTEIFDASNHVLEEMARNAPNKEVEAFITWIYTINNELALLDDRLPVMRELLGNKYATEYEARHPTRSAEALQEPTNALPQGPSLERRDAGETNNSQKKTPSGTVSSEPSAESLDAESKTPVLPSQNTSTSPESCNDNHKKLQFAGNLGIVATCGAFIVDGIKKFGGHNKSSGQKFVQALKIAAGTAGIAVIFAKPDLLSKSMNNIGSLFSRDRG